MPRSQRARSSRAIANDEAIREAGISEVLRVGVDHVSLRDVGHRAGLTHGATYARYEDVDELLVDLWNSILCFRAIAMFELCMTAAEKPHADTIGAVFDLLRDTQPADLACIQLLLTARRIPTLHEEVEPFIHNYLERELCSSPDVSPSHTRGMTIFALLVVQIMANRQFGQDENYHAVLEKLLLETLTTDPKDVGEVKLHDRDDRTFGVVGKSGYTRATISRIARRANCSPGAIYKLYPSKEDLVIAAFHDLMRARWMRVSNFVNVLEEGSITQLLYSATSTTNDVRQNFTLETALAAGQSERLRLAILSQLSELQALIPLLTNVSDDERARLGYLIRSIMFITIGVTFLSTVVGSMQCTNFNQFAEPFRRAILKEGVPTWSEMSRQILELINARGY
jgi:AcrR family transcriptional regulator